MDLNDTVYQFTLLGGVRKISPINKFDLGLRTSPIFHRSSLNTKSWREMGIVLLTNT